MILGTELAPAVQADALRSFPNRYTRTHVPYWVSEGPQYRFPTGPHFDSDADWLAHTRFHVRADGSLFKIRSCESNPTWPDNPENRI